MKPGKNLYIFFTTLFIGIIIFLLSDFITGNPIEKKFYKYEEDFQKAADSYINKVKFTGTKRWLKTMPPGEDMPFLEFHLGPDYRNDFYKPRIVYILSDNYSECASCSFDGKMIEKIKPQWYICKERPY